MGARADLAREVEAAYEKMTPASAALYAQAQDALPGGDTRHSTFVRPYPLFVDGGEGAYVEDVDGNRYLDLVNCASAMILGHAHPAVVEAVSRQVARGTAFAATNRHAAELASLIKERVPGVEKLRFTNSGTEATMMCVRAARAFTGRPAILKMVGAYHGSHDEFQVSGGNPSPGIAPGIEGHVVEVQYNDPDALIAALDAHGHRLAAVIVEGIMGSAGMLPPENGYLRLLREETERRGILLIIDEVISLRLSPGGAQELYGVRPDLTAMGKIIGGGFPVGAFGGREELLQQYSPLKSGYLGHSGTFNANPVTMAAGAATLRELDADGIGYINRLGERLAAGVRRAARAADVPLQVTGVGSLRALLFTPAPPHNGAEAAAADSELARLLHLKLLTEGVMLGKGGMVGLSTVTTEAEIDGAVGRIGDALRWLAPATRD